MLQQKCLALLLAVLLLTPPLLVTTASAAVTAATVSVDSPHAVLLDALSGEVLYAQDAEEKVYPASTTKIMTLVLALEAVASGRVNLDDSVTATENACRLGGTQVYASPGETHSLKDWLVAVAVGSANDGSVVVAEHIAGSEERFAEMMNDKAQELSMVNSHFVNPHGLHDDEHYTTALDMARLARHAVTVPGLLDITGIYRTSFREGTFGLDNYNRLVHTYKGCDGLKTGHTSLAGFCLVATAERERSRFIAVTMASSSATERNSDIVRMLDYAFANYRSIGVAHKGEHLGTARVLKGLVEQVHVISPFQYGLTVDKGEEEGIERQVIIHTLIAPVVMGQPAGEIRLLRGDEVLHSFDLVAKEDVPRASFLHMWRKLLSILLSGR